MGRFEPQQTGLGWENSPVGHWLMGQELLTWGLWTQVNEWIICGCACVYDYCWGGLGFLSSEEPMTPQRLRPAVGPGDRGWAWRDEAQSPTLAPPSGPLAPGIFTSLVARAILCFPPVSLHLIEVFPALICIFSQGNICAQF